MQERDELIHFQEYFALLRRTWPLVLSLVLGGMVVAFVVTTVRTEIYRAQAEIVLAEPPTRSVLSANQWSRQPFDDTSLHTQLRILESELLVSRAVDALLVDLKRQTTDSSPTVSPTGEGPVARSPAEEAQGELPPDADKTYWPKLREYVQSKNAKALATEFQASLGVGFVAKTRIITLETRSPCPQFAAAVANYMAAAYARYVDETFASTAERTFMQLKRQADEAERQTKQNAESLIEFKKASEIDAMTQGIEEVPSTVENKREAIKDRLAMSSPDISTLEDELAKVRSDVAALSKRYKPGHPEIRKFMDRADFLEKQISQLRDRVYAQWERKHLEERNSVEFSMREQELAATRRLHDLLVDKLKEIDLSKDTPALTVQILKRASVPPAASYPRKGTNFFLGAVSGLVVGLALTFMRAHAHSNLISLSIPEGLLPAPLVGRLPHVPDVKALNNLLLGEDSSSYASEAFRALRTAVESMINASSNHVVLVTSPDRGDGKSTIATALTQSFAKLGRRVLLVDVDLRRGELHKVFGVPPKNGMSEAVHGNEEIAPLHIAENFDFLPCGTRTEQPSELLASPRMDAFIKRMAQQYDVVLLDSPPLLAVTDASLLARFAATKIMVVRSLKTHIESSRFAANVLRNLGYEVNGVILNDIKEEETSYSGYYYHRDYDRGYTSTHKEPS